MNSKVVAQFAKCACSKYLILKTDVSREILFQIAKSLKKKIDFCPSNMTFGAVQFLIDKFKESQLMSHIRRFCSAVIVMATVFVSVVGCSGDEPRYEQVSKLRAIGVEQTPANATYGSTVTIKFILAGPSGMTMTAANYTDAAAKYGLPVELSFATSSVVETKYAALSIYSISGTTVVPGQDLLRKFIVGTAPARVRFGASFTATGDDETTVGDILVYPTGSSELAWKSPVVSIVEPLDATISANSKIKTVIATTHSEPNKYSWFVSSGQILNRRAVTTEWKDQATGPQTIIVTARGTKSGSFAYAVKDVTVR